LALPWKTRREGELVEARSTATETISDIWGRVMYLFDLRLRHYAQSSDQEQEGWW